MAPTQDIIVDFQQHVLYAFLISVLQGMAVTSGMMMMMILK